MIVKIYSAWRLWLAWWQQRRWWRQRWWWRWWWWNVDAALMQARVSVQLLQPPTWALSSWFFHHISLSPHPKWKRTMVLEKIPVIGFTSCQNIRVRSIAIRGWIGLNSILENTLGFSKKRLCFTSRQSLHKEAYGTAQKTTRDGVALPYDVLTRIHCLYIDLNIYYYMVGTRAHN